MLIPVEQVDNRNVSFGTDIDREATATCVVIEAEEIKYEWMTCFDCWYVRWLHRVVDSVEEGFGKVPIIGKTFIWIVCIRLK